MRISDWSSDVCSSDLFSTVHLPTSSLTAELPQLITSLSSLPLNLLLVSLTCLIPRALESSLAPLLPFLYGYRYIKSPPPAHQHQQHLQETLAVQSFSSLDQT